MKRKKSKKTAIAEPVVVQSPITLIYPDGSRRTVSADEYKENGFTMPTIRPSKKRGRKR